MSLNYLNDASIRIYVVCLADSEEGKETPYSAFTNFAAAQKYAQIDLPLELGLEQFELKEAEDYRIHNIELHK